MSSDLLSWVPRPREAPLSPSPRCSLQRSCRRIPAMIPPKATRTFPCLNASPFPALRAWHTQCLPGLWKPDVLRSGIVGVRGSMLLQTAAMYDTMFTPGLHSPFRALSWRVIATLYYTRSPRWRIRLSSSLVWVSYVTSTPLECILVYKFVGTFSCAQIDVR